MIRITGVVGEERVVLVEFYDAVGCARACRNGRHAERRERLVAARKAAQAERREANRRVTEASALMPTPPDLTVSELVELTAWRAQELAGVSPLPEPKRQGREDPERLEKTAAVLIANTALAYEQNGLAREVRIEVHE
jgi:hypothetical protein